MEPHAATEIPTMVKCLLVGKSIGGAIAVAEARGAPDRVARMLKKSTASVNDPDYGSVIADRLIAANAFFGSMRSRSVFFRLLDTGFRRTPMRTRTGILSASATGAIVGEGKPVPVGKFSLRTGSLKPDLAAVILVTTDEVARDASAEAQNLITAELRGAVSDTVDERFFQLVVDDDTPTFAYSVTYNPFEALAPLLNAVNDKGTGFLTWAMAPDAANFYALKDPHGTMTPLGGELLGLPAMVSATIPAGTVRLINASRIAANADPIDVDVSNEAALEIDESPTSSSITPTATEMVSLFQTNSTALLARVWFAAERTADNAVAQLTGVPSSAGGQ